VLRALFFGPARSFYRRTNPLWAFGCAAYHVAILLVVSVYGACIALLGWRHVVGAVFPYEASGLVTTLGRDLVLVFGSGDPQVGRFLFGRGSVLLGWLGWFELGLAVIGNGALLVGWLAHGMGAVTHDLDRAAAGLRPSGSRSWEHLGIRLVVFAIIQTEWLGRTGLVPGAVYLHTVLGLTLLLLLPYTYLAHAALAPLAITGAWRRYALRTTA
jgi:hypothetical protein